VSAPGSQPSREQPIHESAVENPGTWDTAYERKAVLLLCLGFGLVGLDRWIIAPLFPAMMRDLKLSYQDLGDITGVLAMAWGVFAIFFGGVSDRFGRRRVVIPALILFSLLSGFTGAVGSIVSLLVLRSFMGATEGAYCAASVAATGEASAPQRRGMNLGLQMSAFPLLGLGIGPIIATQLLAVLPSWRWVFALVAIPGLIVAAFMRKILREPTHLNRSAPLPRNHWLVLLRSRNIIVAMLAIFCSMSCIFVLGAMVPNYLTDYLKIVPAEMGLLMSALGFGGFCGDFLIAAASDYLGRKPTIILCFIAAAGSVYALTLVGADFIPLYSTLFLVSVFCFGVLSTMTGPIATEAVPVTLAASAVGLVTGAGEFSGGGVAPVIAGYVAQHFGIQNTLYVGLAGLAVGLFVSLLLTETAPRRIRRPHVAMQGS
jgi:MFS family permease